MALTATRTRFQTIEVRSSHDGRFWVTRWDSRVDPLDHRKCTKTREHLEMVNGEPVWETHPEGAAVAAVAESLDELLPIVADVLSEPDLAPGRCPCFGCIEQRSEA